MKTKSIEQYTEKERYKRYTAEEQIEQAKELLKLDDKQDRVIGLIYLAPDGKVFKKYKGNRHTTDKNISKIEQSFEAMGNTFLPIPTVVNGDMKEIDGQHRVDFCYNKDFGVPYQIIHGIGYEEMIALNEGKSNWTNKDRITFCAEGLESDSFKILQMLQDEYADVGDDVIAIAVFRLNSLASRDIINGRLLITEDMLKEAIPILDFVRNFVIEKEKLKLPKTSFNIMKKVVARCYRYEDVDNKRLVKKILSEYKLHGRWNSMESCVAVVNDMYNSYLPSDKRVNISRLYEEDIGPKQKNRYKKGTSIFAQKGIDNPFEKNFAKKKPHYEKHIG
jgi:hypothetical protein